MCLNTKHLKSLPHLPGANELLHCCWLSDKEYGQIRDTMYYVSLSYIYDNLWALEFKSLDDVMEIIPKSFAHFHRLVH